MARILTLTNWYPPHSYGGYEVVCHDVLHGLAGKGHQIEVLCSTERRTGAPAEESAFPVHRELQMYWRDDVPWTPRLNRQLAIERANQRALRTVLERFEPEVVSVWHMGALSLSLLTTIEARGLPMVFGIADDWPTYALALDPWSGRWSGAPAVGRLANNVLRTPTVVGDVGAMGRFCFISESNLVRCVEGSPWAFPATAVVHAGVELSRFPPPSDDVGPWAWNVLYVGRLDPRKGTQTLLRAMAELDAPATLTFCTQTQGTERAEHEALVRSLGLGERVSFVEAAHDEIAAVYRAHDCVVFSSEWPEPFGLVPLEAMASGTPVIATGVGGSAEFLVENENCLRYPPGDAPGLAQALTRLAGDDALRATLRRHGLTTAQAFDQRHTTDAYDHWHTQAVAGAHA